MRKIHGLTLLELLVAVAIVSLLFAIGLAQYQRFNRRQILAQAANQLKSNLRFAQDKALAGEKPGSWCNNPGEVLKGHQLRFSSLTVYEIEAVCSDNSRAGIKTINLPGGIRWDNTSGNVVLFKVLGLGIEGNSVTMGLIGQTGGSKAVTVTETGEIR